MGEGGLNTLEAEIYNFLIISMDFITSTTWQTGGDLFYKCSQALVMDFHWFNPWINKLSKI